MLIEFFFVLIYIFFFFFNFRLEDARQEVIDISAQYSATLLDLEAASKALKVVSDEDKQTKMLLRASEDLCSQVNKVNKSTNELFFFFLFCSRPFPLGHWVKLLLVGNLNDLKPYYL